MRIIFAAYSKRNERPKVQKKAEIGKSRTPGPGENDQGNNHKHKRKMTNETNTAANERDMMKDLNRYVDRQIDRCKGIVKDSMEDMTRDFNENFEWASERIYKTNLRLEFLESLKKLLEDDECNIEAARFYLRHAAEHAADDIMHRDPYRNSSNAAANLTHRWTYENYKEEYHLALNLLDRITPDND